MPAPERLKPGKGCPRLVYPNRSTAQHKEQKAVWKFKKKYQSVFTKQPLMAEGHSCNPQGPYYYQKDGQMYASLPLEIIQNIQQCPHYAQMKKDCEAEGSQDPCNNAATISTTHGSWDNASNAQSQSVQRDGREIQNSWGSDQVSDAGVPDFPAATEARHTGTPKSQVKHIALQTDSCDTIYVTKDTLVTYTIAVLQNTQSLQYEQMQVVLQTAQNNASIQTPLRAEKLMTAHFNLAILTNNTASEKPANAQESEVAVADPSPSTSTSDQEMTCNTSYKCKGDLAIARTRMQPTGAVTPNRRSDYGLVCAIPVGYESDNSWDGISTIGEQDNLRNNDITSIIAFRMWTNRRNRG